MLNSQNLYRRKARAQKYRETQTGEGLFYYMYIGIQKQHQITSVFYLH